MNNKRRRGKGKTGGHRPRGDDRRKDEGLPRQRSGGGYQPPWAESTEGWERDYTPRRRGRGGSMQHMFLGSKVDVTVIIRTHNAGEYLEELLDAIKSQESPYEVEVIAVDAGSTDRTSIILRSRGIRVHHVDEGKPFRKLAAGMAQGDAVVFMCQDALPLTNGWLYSLATPVIEEEDLGTAYGRIIADASVPPYQRGLYNARAYASGKQPLAFTQDDGSEASFFVPGTNYAIARRLIRKVPQLDVHDRALARLAYGAGLSKTYLPEGAVVLRSGHLPACLLDDVPDDLPSSLAVVVRKETWRLFSELYQLSDGSDLPKGERGEAYAIAFGLHFARLARHMYHQSAMARRIADAITPALRRRLG